MVLGNNNGFMNLTTQIQNLTSDVSQFRDEIISKIEVDMKNVCFGNSFVLTFFKQDTEHLLNHSVLVLPDFLNDSVHPIFQFPFVQEENLDQNDDGNVRLSIKRILTI